MALEQMILETRPISDLRTHLNEIEEIAEQTWQPIVLTRNGKPKLVVMDSQAYNERIQHERIVLKLREAEIEEKYVKRTISLDSVKSRAQQIIDAAEKIHA